MILIPAIVVQVFVLNVYTIQVVRIVKHVERDFSVMHLDLINVFHVIVVLVEYPIKYVTVEQVHVFAKNMLKIQKQVDVVHNVSMVIGV